MCTGVTGNKIPNLNFSGTKRKNSTHPQNFFFFFFNGKEEKPNLTSRTSRKSRNVSVMKRKTTQYNTAKLSQSSSNMAAPAHRNTARENVVSTSLAAPKAVATYRHVLRRVDPLVEPLEVCSDGTTRAVTDIRGTCGLQRWDNVCCDRLQRYISGGTT